jgi:probable rRNA maturation factor
MDDPDTKPPSSNSWDGRPPLAIDLIDRHRLLGGAGVDWVRAGAARALAPLGCTGEVRVAVVGDEEMARAHEEFLGMPSTTDVLTFDGSEASASGEPVLDVDIMVCIDEARRQGAVHGHAPERELLLYIVHGVLHCLGFDDHDEESAAAMHRREDELLAGAGVGATFDPGRSLA